MPPLIRILSDGRPGHVNQSIGLARALQKRAGGEIEIVTLKDDDSLVEKLGRAAAFTSERTADVVIAAGRRTHLPLVWTTRMQKAKSVLIMRPSLPRRCFDFLLIPEHDLSKDPGGHIIRTKGALNKISEDATEKQQKGLILIGGESRHSSWDKEGLLKALHEILSRSTDLEWTLTDSRRTPSDFLPAIQELSLPVTILPHQETSEDWLPEQLSVSRDVWVTPDSASMVNEALTARCAVGLLPLPQHDTKVSRGVVRAVSEGAITSYEDWEKGQSLAVGSTSFHEAARCADLLIERGLFR